MDFFLYYFSSINCSLVIYLLDMYLLELKVTRLGGGGVEIKLKGKKVNQLPVFGLE